MCGILLAHQLCRLRHSDVSEICGDVAIARNHLAAFAIERGILRLEGRETIYVAVVHAEGSRDENRVVNFKIGRPLLARTLHPFRGHLLAALPDLTGNDQQRLEFVGDLRAEQCGADGGSCIRPSLVSILC